MDWLKSLRVHSSLELFVVILNEKCKVFFVGVFFVEIEKFWLKTELFELWRALFFTLLFPY